MGIPPQSGADIDSQRLPRDSAVFKGVALQSFVEVCREFLSEAPNAAAGGSCKGSCQEDSVKLHAALARVRGLLTELGSSPMDSDALCPSVREELQEFAEMAEKNQKTEAKITGQDQQRLLQ